ncbi:putative Zn-dependent peptidase/thiol-disulfide isomerase/thioredoxin [Filimonas zeae]|uniref:Thioredoxin domain-containing protein n=1 Tax=Filimonas zeae TaxID=1737353 RepID=A0A917ISJ7_9BACT|nr:insulinase family protein [Filimonas zeae]MDR6338065.1 putative Zn-dependent peptidase/thiol-disulfide isomerase/thioredoxin [Filimonas zeae]GGH61543.1 hypothetical protein GCM10011379_10630 [Filimonas zeae]
MKKISVFMALVLSLPAMAQQSVVVSGYADTSLHASAIYFYDKVWPFPVLTDSCEVKKDGSFTARLPQKTSGVYLVSVGEGTQYGLWADKPAVQVSFDKRGIPVETGAASEALMNQANQLQAERQAGMSANPSAAFRKYKTQLLELVKTGKDVPSVVYLLGLYDYETDRELIDEVTAVLLTKHPDNKAVQWYVQEARRLRKGAPAPDFTYITPTGAKTTLQQQLRKAKYTLVDFWGTYCIPCREGIPGIKKLYEAYRSKGLGILAISLDDKDDLWKKSLKEEAMPWAQGRVEDRGRGLMKQFRFSGIPYLGVFDSAGKIVALAMSHHELEETFKALMGAPDASTKVENDELPIEQSAAEKAAISKMLQRDLCSDVEWILKTFTADSFKVAYLEQLKAITPLKVYQEGKLGYSLSLFYASLQQVNRSGADKAAKQKSYDSLERKQLGFLRMVLYKNQYGQYLRFRANNGMLPRPLPLASGVRTGVLPNGFTYFISRNQVPENQVLLYLVNKVGSIREEAHERGLAHFMEHMNFNGTRHFPGSQLVDYLQKAGVRFGADLNAYTGFHETVYELPVSSRDTVVLENAFRVMRDWASEATLDSLEIEKERGVVLEEKRLGKGAAERANQLFFPVMVNNSRYAYRLPIGNDTVLKTFTPETLRQFHRKWYRPDLQALIVVGDIDVAKTEQWITEQFSTLVRPAAAVAAADYSIPLTDNNQFATVTDAEITSTQIQIVTRRKAGSLRTENDYREHIKQQLLNRLVKQRIAAEADEVKEPAFSAVNAGLQPLMGGVEMFSVDIAVREDLIHEAFQQSWRMIERLRKHGFTAAELARARKAYTTAMENAYRERDKRSSKSIVSELQQYFLNGTGMPGMEWERGFVKESLDVITVEDMNALLADYLTPANQVILIQAPEKNKGRLPDESTVYAWMQAIGAEPFTTYKEQEAAQALMTTPLAAGSTVAVRTVAPLSITELTLSNGVKVVLKPTSFRNNEILYYAFAAGGTNVYPDSLFASAALAAGAISSMGLGSRAPAELSRMLNGKTINASVFIKDRSKGLAGSCAPDDLETALQLIYLQFTAPRTDNRIYSNMINGMKASLLNRYADPVNVFNDTVNYVMGGYHPRSAPLSFSTISNVKLAAMEQVYRKSFADAAAFTFLFTGSFDTAAIRPLLEQYLGALPALHQKNVKPLVSANPAPAGNVTRIVRKGKEEKATVRLVLSGADKTDAMKQLSLQTLGEILEMRLLQSLREQEGEVYSPSVKTASSKYPTPRFTINISFGCAPQNAEHLINLVKRAMESLIKEGPAEAEVQKCRAAHTKLMEQALQNNNFWMGYLSSQYENGEDPLQVLEYKKYLDRLSPALLQKEAKMYLGTPDQATFVLLPE